MNDMCTLLPKAFDKARDKDELLLEIAKALDTLKSCDITAYTNVYDCLQEIVYCIPQDEAERIVRHMEPKGQNWSYNQIKDYVESQGITNGFVNWYLVMNMTYNDYYNTAKAFNLQNDTDFYFSLAKDFIFDQDAEPFKVEKYFS